MMAESSDPEMRVFGRRLPLTPNADNLEPNTDPDVTDMDEGLLSAEICAEEKRMEKIAERDRKKIEFDVERQAANELMEKELKAKRTKRLQHVLRQSEFYSNFMKNKLAEQAKKRPVRKAKPMKKANEAESQEPRKRVKLLKHTDKYNMADIVETINLDTSDESDESDSAEEADDDDDDDNGTYINTMGFTVSNRQPRLFEGGQMRDYQLDGLKWLQTMDGNSVNGILGDEMGLGKTIQVIALLCQLVDNGLPGPYVVVAPLSTLPNWVSEFERFAPQLPIMLFHGNEAKRTALRREFRKKHRVGSVSMQPIVLTSFQVPIVESTFFQRQSWRHLIVDEGHRLKNHNSQLAMELQKYNTANRLILTGTPLQNNLIELWALLHFLLPDIFAELSVFESWFESIDLHKNQQDILQQEENSQAVSTLQKVLSPFLLRRTKADINLLLPPKKEVLVQCPMSPLQIQLYQATLDRSIMLLAKKKDDEEIDLFGPRRKRRCVERREKLKKTYALPESDDDFEEEEENKQVLELVATGNSSYKFRIKMQMPHQVLRHITNHPYLVQMPIFPGTRDIRIDEEVVQHSGKMLVMDAMLAKLKQRGHKVLIFSESCMMLDLLEDMMRMRGHNFCRLDGTVHLSDRQTQIYEFNTDPSMFVFLISTRAGGLGINLVAADTVILYDSSYNPQVDLQAQDRCHRIGQTRPVVVYRFYTKGTVDEAIIHWAQDKRRLEKIVIQKGAFRFKNKIQEMHRISLPELEALLKAEDHERVFHSNGYVFTDEELDNLLDRSAMMDWDKKPLPSDDQEKTEEGEKEVTSEETGKTEKGEKEVTSEETEKKIEKKIIKKKVIKKK